MLYSEMKAFVRSHADTDAIDAPDENLDVYARAAYNDIRRRLGKWDEYHGSDTLTTTAGTVSYVLSGGGFTAGNIEMVTGVVGGSSKLVYVPWDRYLEMRDGTDVTISASEASCYSIKDGAVFLYPDPSTSGETYTVYGYQTWSEWPSGAAAPPLPDEFHEPICWYMLSRYYAAQEDLELAQIWMRDYEQATARMLAFSQRKDSHRPRVFGGKFRQYLSYPDWVRRNTQG